VKGKFPMDRFSLKNISDNKQEGNKTQGGDKGGKGGKSWRPPWLFGKQDSSSSSKGQNVEVYYVEELRFGMPQLVQRTRPRRSSNDEFAYIESSSKSGEGSQAPKEFHNRPLLATTTDENNCAIDAILLSDNPKRSNEEKADIIRQARNYMVKKGYVKRGEQIEVDHMTGDDVTHGKILVDFLSKNKFIRENAGLTVHYLPEYKAMGDHMQLAPGEDQLHIFRAYPERDGDNRSRDNAHFWGMGAEIEPGAWNPQYDHDEVIKDSISSSSSSCRESNRGRQEEVEMVDQRSLEDK
jgi:hypothetical protein